MATTTLTMNAAMQARLPRSQGTIHLEQSYNRSVSASAGDIFWFNNLRVPHGAYITKLVAKHDTSEGQVIWQFGLGGGITSGALFGSATISDTQTVDTLVDGEAAGKVAIKVSVSDDQPRRWAVITATQDGAVGSSPTGSLSITLILEYTMTPQG